MIALTICSNNYLGKAQILAKSIKKNQTCEVYLFLADIRHPSIDYVSLGFDQVIVPEELGIKNLQWQLENYGIIEFNTAIKPFAFEYIFKNTDHDEVYYFDPDIKVYQSLENFSKLWHNKSILITPHILTPIPLDDLFPGENLFLNHGIYNLGFIGLKRSEIASQFLKWWSDRLSKYCVIDLKEGYFTDQIWINFIPLFFKDIEITLHPGLNVAYWNLHERVVSFNEKEPTVNYQNKLFFFHFSSFDKELKILTPTDQPRYTFENRPEMIPLYSDYLKDLVEHAFVNPSFTYYDGLYPVSKKPISRFQRIQKKIQRFI